MKKERIEFLDAVKGTGILLVVFCHFVTLSNETIIGNFFMSLAWSAVPCFMMTSGAILHQKQEFSWTKYIRQMVRTYAVICIWRLIYLLVYYQIVELHYGKRDLIQYIFLFKDLDSVNTGVMWYMIAYMVVMCLYPVTYHLFREHNRNVLGFTMGLAFLSGILIPSANWIMTELCDKFQHQTISFNGLSKLLPFSNYGNMIFYFILGAYLFEYKKILLSKIKCWILFPVIIIGTFCVMFIKYAEIGTFSWSGIYLSNGYSHISVMICAIAIWLAFCGYADKHRSLHHFLGKYIGQYTMGIYYLHYILLAVLSATLYPLLKDSYSFGTNCIKTLLVTLICVILTKIIRKIPGLRILVK